MKLIKLIPKTQMEEIKSLFPDYDTTKLEAVYDTMGNIISIKTDNITLINLLKSKGFTET